MRFRGLRDDLAHALRQMARAPAFTALTVVMLALGTGANVAMFTVIDAVMLRTPFPRPDELALLRVVDRNGRLSARVPFDQYAALSSDRRTLAAVAALSAGTHVLTGAGDPQRPDFECVSASMFDVLATPPLLGRVFTPDDDRPGAAPTVVLSHPFWQQLGQPALGSVLRLNEQAVTVIGVMPRGFAGPFSRNDTSGWLPLQVTLTGNGVTGCRAGAAVNAFARVRRDLSLAEAQAALPGVTLLSLMDQTFDELRTPLFALVAAVGCVLLIACLNVGGLQLERAAARRRDVALRLALGASRARIARQTLIEHLLLGTLAAAAGVAAAAATLGALVSLLPTNIPHLAEIELNRRVLAAAVAVGIAAGLVSCVPPILQGRVVAPSQDLGHGSRTMTTGMPWARRGLVVAQIALSLVVLIGAGLMIRTFLILRPSAPGFDARGKLTTMVQRPGERAEASALFFAQLFDRVRAIPGVRSVSGTSYLPMMGVVSVTPLTIEDRTLDVFGAAITPEYLEQMQIRTIAGRGFTTADGAGAAPVAIVNERLARQLRPDGAVVGTRVLLPPPRQLKGTPIEREIVGVIANTRSLGAHTRPGAEVYVPYAQSPTTMLHLIADADTRQLGSIGAEIRRVLRQLDPQLVVEPPRHFAEMVDSRVARPRLGAWLLGLLAGLAVALSAIGLMTTLGWWVMQRVRELGIRVALGASRAQVTRLVLRQGLLLGGGGIAAGCLGAIGVTRYLQGWIYGVTPLDTPTFVGAAVLMLAAAGAAIVLPMRRALTVDPIVVLRTE